MRTAAARTARPAGQFEVPEHGDGDYRLTCGSPDAVVSVDTSAAYFAGVAHYVGEGLDAGLLAGTGTAAAGGIMACVGASG